jgi:hypothetical protein
MRKLITSLAAVMLLVVAAPAAFAQSEEGGQVTVVHGIPGLTVDVFVNGDLTLEDFEPGDVAGPLALPAGDYDLAIAPADAGIEGAVLTGTATVTDGLNASIIANLDADGAPTINIFVNDTSPIEAGESRLVVRHTAAAPEVDILLADGTELFTGVSNPQEGVIDVPAGTYDVEIAPAGAGVEGSVFSVSGVELPEGTARIVYATGSLADDTFGLVIQDIANLHSAPETVNTGGELAGSGFPIVPMIILALALVALATSVPTVAARRNR